MGTTMRVIAVVVLVQGVLLLGMGVAGLVAVSMPERLLADEPGGRITASWAAHGSTLGTSDVTQITGIAVYTDGSNQTCVPHTFWGSCSFHAKFAVGTLHLQAGTHNVSRPFVVIASESGEIELGSKGAVVLERLHATGAVKLMVIGVFAAVVTGFLGASLWGNMPAVSILAAVFTLILGLFVSGFLAATAVAAIVAALATKDAMPAPPGKNEGSRGEDPGNLGRDIG